MKASELRIGNKFWYGKNNTEETVYWMSFEIREGLLINGQMPEAHCNAIPLTEEWLLKFSCKKLGTNWWESPNGIQFNFDQENNCGLITFGSRQVNFWYVHTFQNIIFLTGEELTIKQ